MFQPDLLQRNQTFREPGSAFEHSRVRTLEKSIKSDCLASQQSLT